MTVDYEKMKQEESDLSARLQERMSVQEPIPKCIKYLSSDMSRNVVKKSDSNKEEQRRNGINEVMGEAEGLALTTKTTLKTKTSLNTKTDKTKTDKANKELRNHREKLESGQSFKRQFPARFKVVNMDCMGCKNALNRDRKPVVREEQCIVEEKYIPRRDLKSLVINVLEHLPYALPTLNLHLILSLTMVLLTHQCPSKYFIAV